MDLKSLNCPNCGGSLEIEDGLDTFFCKYCGHKIMLEGQSDAAYDAKVRVKSMEHKERMQDKRDAQKRYKTEAKEREEKRTLITIFAIFGGIFLLISLLPISAVIVDRVQERELEKTVEEILVDIENEDFAAAYIKANLLHWDGSYTDEQKWEATRKEIIKQIEQAEAEAKAKGDPPNPPPEEEDNGGLFDWIK